MNTLSRSFLCCLLPMGLLQAQINFVNDASALGLNHTVGDVYLGAGVSFCDYNDDGWDDLTVNTESGSSVLFFRNNSGVFVADPIVLPNLNHQTKQVNWVDFDNDGDKDLFVTSDAQHCRLFENDGFLNFTDITESAGFPTEIMLTYGASWGDINNDGYLDVYLSNRDISNTHSNKLYQNNGDGTFTDVSVAAGVDATSLSFCSAFFDYNNDGWQDIYLANDKEYTSNILYENNGDGTFTDVSQLSHTDVSIDAMSTTIGDYNNDGWFDIYVTNTHLGNVFLQNNGDGTFSDIADVTGTLFESIGWGAVFLDADNDKDEDLYVSGSFNVELPCCLPAAFYENHNDGTFSHGSSNGFVGDLGQSYSNAIGDVDNDGKPDIAVANIEGPMFLWHNTTNTTHNYLKVKLRGTSSNRDGVGSKIEIAVNGQKQYRYTLCGEGYLAQNSSAEFFGLGNATSVDYVKVTWLSGIEDIIYNVSSNQMLEIEEGQGTLHAETALQPRLKLFPNPTTQGFQLASEFGAYHLKIRTILGSLIYSNNIAESRKYISVEGWNSGVYILEIQTSENRWTQKLIIRH